MVYFVCETCNETLKKAQVEKHVFSCRNCWGVTCVDCNHTFEGESFREHTSCVSEDQKYQGALFKAPKAKTKNRGVNEIWTDAVARAATAAARGTAPKAICAHLTRMGDLGNVPRQEKKFKNFVKNSLRVFDDASAVKLWVYLDGIRNDIAQEEKHATDSAAAPKGATKTAEKVAEKSSEASTKKEKVRKKRARDEEADNKENSASKEASTDKKRARAEEEPGENEGPTIVDAATRRALGKAAVGVLKKEPNNELALKRLVKQALVAAKAKGSLASDVDDKSLKRALRQQLNAGLVKRVTVAVSVATYSRD